MEEIIKKFLVQRISDDGSFFLSIMSANELCDYINMNDCYNESYEIWDMSEFGKARHCHYAGWQEGCLIEVIRDDDQQLVVSLYGQDH